jgi:cell division protein FtsW
MTPLREPTRTARTPRLRTDHTEESLPPLFDEPEPLLDEPPPLPLALRPEIVDPLPVVAPRSPTPDLLLYATVLGLVSFGLVMVYSASAVYATQKFGSPTYFFRRDLLWTVMGLFAMHVASRTDFSFWKRVATPVLISALVLLAGVLLFGARINGARRWFHLGGFSFQPAELAKIALVIFLASTLARKAERIKLFSVGVVPPMLVCGVMVGLILKQPDLGTSVIIALGTLIMLFIAGARISYLLIFALLGAPVVYQAIVGTPWRLRRMLAFLDPWQYRFDVGYQITESLISIGSGGMSGLGLGDGRQKLFFLPEAHTDYIMAIVGEELGFYGLVGVACAFAVLVWRGVRTALRARDSFGCYLAYGVTAMFGLQALVNIGVVLGSLPTKGLPLPFVSYGGSTLVVDLFAIGILLNISKELPEPAQRDNRPSLLPLWLRSLLDRDSRPFNRRKARRAGRVVVVNARATRPSRPGFAS